MEEKLKGREAQIVKERIRKLEEIKKQGIDPYPDKYEKTHSSGEILENYSKLKEEENSKESVKISGRIMAKRDMGKISFATLQDSEGRIQVSLKEGETPSEKKELFKKYIDSGDFIGVEGNVTRTKRGELSVVVKELTLLSKSIFPLPDKYHGLRDEEERLRKRYLDILINPEVKDLFVKRSKFWNATRKFLLERGFLEVETPVLENSAGGAAATPFVTKHNALDLDVYLRISMGELWQKKLMVAGYEKTFEIGRQFRNEGMDAEHLQDYTQMEFYWAYANFEDGMKLAEEMYKEIAKEVLGKLKFRARGHEVDLGKKWKRYDYEKTIEDFTGLNIYNSGKEDVIKKLKDLGEEFDPSVDKWRLIDVLWKYCRKKISGPGFLVGQPVEISPLAKRKSEDSKKVQQFQVIIAGTELGNGYSELNDPVDQEERFEKQMELKEAGDEEAQEHDKGFVEALKYGMPPTCGFGFSERFFAYLVDKTGRESQIFPLMKPEDYKERLKKGTSKSKQKK